MAKRDTRKSKKTERKNRKETRKQDGGKRKQTAWMKKVMETYREMKKKNPSTRLGDAMKEAKKRS